MTPNPDDPAHVQPASTDRPRRTRWPRHPDEYWILLTPEMRADLRTRIKQARVTPESLLADTELPKGLSVRVLRGWMCGEVKSLNAAHWAYVIHRLASPPTGTQPITAPLRRNRTKIGSHHPNHRPITDAERDLLQAHRQRTGLGADRLLDSVADKPKGLSAATIKGWLTGKTQTADPALIAYVLACYASVPTRTRQPRR